MRLSRTAALAVLGLASPLALMTPAHAAVPTDPVIKQQQFAAQTGTQYDSGSCTATNSGGQAVKPIASDGTTYRVKKSSTATVTSNSDPNDTTDLSSAARGAVTVTRKAGGLDTLRFVGSTKATSTKALGSSSVCDAEATAQAYFSGLVKIADRGAMKISSANAGNATSLIELVNMRTGAVVLDFQGGTNSSSKRSTALKPGKYLLAVGSIAQSSGQPLILLRGSRAGSTKISMDFVPR